MTEKELPLDGQVLAYVDFNPDPDEVYGSDPEIVSSVDDANLITSMVVPKKSVPDPFEDPFSLDEIGFARDRWHKVAIDIDLPVKLIPSTQENHFHLYIDKEISWDKYVNLLNALADCGIVEPGYVAASCVRGFTALRLPWVKKDLDNKED